MKSIDVKKAENQQLAADLAAAMKGDDEEAYAKAFAAYAKSVEDKVIAKAQEMTAVVDSKVLAGRGIRCLTCEETKYYNALTNAMRSGNVKMAFDGEEMRMPETIVEQILGDVTTRHPLLEAVNFTNTSLLTSWDVNVQGPQAAIWGDITAAITEELNGEVTTEQITLAKLSAFFPISNAMLDLGPAWIDRYIREILVEAIALGVENAIIDGTGLKQPIGMTRDLDASVSQSTGYTRKESVAVTEFTPKKYGELVAKLAVDRNEKTRNIENLVLIVNPLDYYTLVMPATVRQTVDGGYVNDVFPVPTKVITAAGVKRGEAILGLGNNYWLGVGAGTAGGKIEYSDEYKWLEEQRYYKVKLFGNGRPVDNTSFILLDISGLKEHIRRVKTVTDAE